MKSFDEWFEKQDIDNWTNKKFMLKAFEAGQQSKQAEVDELIDTIKTSAESEMYLFDELQKVKGERDELWKRIDMALDHTVNHGGYDDLTHIINILKGEETK